MTTPPWSSVERVPSPLRPSIRRALQSARHASACRHRRYSARLGLGAGATRSPRRGTRGRFARRSRKLKGVAAQSRQRAPVVRHRGGAGVDHHERPFPGASAPVKLARVRRRRRCHACGRGRGRRVGRNQASHRLRAGTRLSARRSASSGYTCCCRSRTCCSRAHCP
jgi:hypothetical protein